MTSRDFCFWLQGFFEVGGAKTLSDNQTHLVRKHLDLVFKHEIDPSMGSPERQDELNAIHEKVKAMDAEQKKIAAVAEGAASHHVLLRC